MRAGTFTTFTKRYQPIELNGSIERHHSDPEVCARFDAQQFEYVWTVVSGDRGGSYIIPGFHSVNYESRILCAVPYPEAEVSKAGYRY